MSQPHQFETRKRKRHQDVSDGQDTEVSSASKLSQDLCFHKPSLPQTFNIHFSTNDFFLSIGTTLNVDGIPHSNRASYYLEPTFRIARSSRSPDNAHSGPLRRRSSSMRILSLCATAFAAAGAAAQSTSGTTVTITRTVERVVQTTWATSTPATQSTSTFAWAARVPSSYVSYPSNGTTSHATGTGVWTSLAFSSATGSAPITPATGAASKLGFDAVGLAAVAGLVGLLAF